MTLLIGTTQGDAAHIISDGASYDAAGKVTAIESKVAIFPEWNAAISYEGWTHPEHIKIMARGSGFTSGRDLVRGLGELAFDVLDWQLRHEPNAPSPELLLCAAVFAPEVGPSVWVAHSGGQAVRQGLTPGQPRHVQAYSNFGAITEALGRDADLRDARSFDLIRDGRIVAEAARRSDWNEGDEGAGVGGFVELTTVSAGGVQSRVFKRWSDKVGRRIELKKAANRRFGTNRRGGAPTRQAEMCHG